MPPSDKRSRSATGASSSRKSPQAGQGAPRPSGKRPPATRQPVNRQGGSRAASQRRARPQPDSSFRGTLNRIFPPFSAQRYVGIWLLVMVPLIIVLLLLLRGPGANNSTGATSSGTTVPAPTIASGAGAGSTAPTPASVPASLLTVSPIGPGKYMTIETTKGTIVAKLYTDPAANVSKTVANFQDKASKGYFNGLTFHRVEDWVIQGGDPTGTGSGGSMMPAEYNNIPFKAGALGVARSGDPTVNNDSQFFITKSDADWLNGQYTNWGQVIQGMDVVNKIAIGDKMTKITIEDRK